MAVTARTEILATAEVPLPTAECSTAVLLPPGNAAPWTLQTWDWYSDLVPEGLVLEYVSGAGLGVRTFTEFGAPAKIGVNDAGLGVHFNILHHESDRGTGGGVPVHSIARRILDTATTVAEAVAVARSARVSASTVLTVVTREPDAVCIELCPDGVGVVQPWVGGTEPGTRVLLHTNHFLTPELAARGRVLAKESTERYEHLNAVSHGLAVPSSAAELAEALCGAEGEDASICMRPVPGGPPEEQAETLLTVSLDVESARMECTASSPAEFARSQPR